MSPPESLPTVVYIAGYGRSGSTVLDVLLGNCPEVCAVGELFMFFRPGETERCGCGASVADCRFWQAVRDEYRRLMGELPDDAQGLAFRRQVEGVGSLFVPRKHPRYAESQRALLSAVVTAGGVTTVVDSSKTAIEVARRPAALRAAGMRVKVIHLIRDGRGCMWSLLRGCNRKLERGESDPQLAFPRLRAVLGWLQANLAALGRDTLRVRYEDLVRDPAGELARIGRFLEIDTSEVVHRLANGETLRSGHSISGNRLRHTGINQLQADDEWREKLSFGSRLLYWAFAWPLHALLLRKPIGDSASQSSPQPVASN